MKIRCLDIRLDALHCANDQVVADQFMATVEVVHVNSQFVEQNHAWSVVVAYNDKQGAASSQQTVDPYGGKIFSYNGEQPRLPRVDTPPSKKPITATEPADLKEPLVDKHGKIAYHAKAPLNQEEQSRYDHLRTWRNTTAQEQGLPPFYIASNTELVTIAKANIEKPEDLLAIRGFGDRKIEAYGAGIVALLNSI